MVHARIPAADVTHVAFPGPWVQGPALGVPPDRHGDGNGPMEDIVARQAIRPVDRLGTFEHDEATYRAR